MSRLFSFSDYNVTTQRITSGNWLLKVEIANHIYYLRSVCVIIIINKAWHLLFATPRTPRKKISEVRKATYRASTVWPIIFDIIHYRMMLTTPRHFPSCHGTAAVRKKKYPQLRRFVIMLVLLESIVSKYQ